MTTLSLIAGLMTKQPVTPVVRFQSAARLAVLPTDRFQLQGAASVRFGKGLDFATQELLVLRNVLRGVMTSTTGSVTAIPQKETVKRLKAILTTPDKKLSGAELRDLGKQLGRFHAYLTDSVQFDLNHFTREAASLERDVRQEVRPVIKTLDKLGMAKAGQAIFAEWAALVSPTLKAFNFADAIPHAAQVANLAVIRAHQYNLSPVEQLMASLVGFGHDPKIKGSYHNLATHPVIASALLADALEGPLQEKVSAFLDEYGEGVTFQQFRDAAVAAIGINNDSKFINEKVILPYVLKENPKLDNDDFKSTFWQRFNALATGETPKAFTSEQVQQLLKVSFDSGLFITESGVRKSVKVSALSLMNNSEALADSMAKRVAQILAESDNSLLSMPKLIQTAAEKPTALERAGRFLESFENNVLALPGGKTRALLREWQRDMYRSVFEAAQLLTGKNNWNKDWDTVPLNLVASKPPVLEAIETVIKDPSIWIKNQGQADAVDFMNLNLSSLSSVDTPQEQKNRIIGLRDTLVSTLQKTYDKALLTSKAMFNIG